ncbi:hypothetical protein DFO67_10470 [Modicisalibacter xianhensis]|uniref:Polysaccharide lyase 14 domain-containing protein n=1 Tax=Modicisalibacter xianhensis TaxID=442341 RepID=A0A4R8G447_9GAMM|nr:hypothetical protein [Halomonas xianhensis]TDX30815.1 hypothetical protein DFO67_10470 [Halomonas xianhensis]
MAQLEIMSFERTGSELLLRFNNEADAKRMEAALGVAFPEEEEPVPEVPSKEAPVIRVQEGAIWHDGMVLDVWVTNKTAADKILSVGLVANSVIDDLWGGIYDIDDGEYVITSSKPIGPGGTWDFTIKLKGSDHTYEFLGVEPVEQTPDPAEQPEQPEPVAVSQDAPGTLVHAPEIDPRISAEANIMGALGGVQDGSWDLQNIEVIADPDGNILRTHMGKGLYVGDKGKMRGAGFDTRTMKVTHAVLEYDLRFKPGFDPVKGGKLPGLMAGDSPSGHKEALNGMTARMMWRREAQGELYLYYPDMKESHGDSIGRGNFYFDTSGKWHTIRQEVKLNDVGKANGYIKVWYDGVPVIEATGLRLRTKDSVLIEGIMHTIFPGGGDRSWAVTRDEWVDTRNFRIYTP